MNGIELIRKAEVAKQAGASRVEIIGRWVWAWFTGVPSPQARQVLKDARYKWNAKRKVWQFAGVPCRYTKAGTFQIRAKYGSRVVTEEAA